ncbi:MAG: aminopeptidase N C-terminal domain-containing protein, partial [Bdellovibrionales bacterium]
VLALSFWSLSEEAHRLALVCEGALLSTFMTSRLIALQLLLDRNLPFQNEALNLFKSHFSDNSIVMNKWFMVQSGQQNKNCFESVKKLTKDSSFDYKNPNKVYSLLRSFGQNSFRFFDQETEALNWYAHQIAFVDQTNPQVAARLCDAYNLVSRLPTGDQKRLAKSLQPLKQLKLSQNVRELIEKVGRSAGDDAWT